MTLSMKTYKGYEKLPYCNTHYPTTRHTTVAETPENLRLKKNTANQSQATYQKDFIQEKGKVTQVADTPEALRLLKAQKNASVTEYQQATVGIRKESESVQPPRLPSQGSINQEPVNRLPEREPEYTPPPPQQYAPEPVRAPVPPPAAPVGNKYVAIYDYAAADDDEVTLIEGDIITEGEMIDDGWMTGRVERTGEHGMLPSNYVELCS